MELGFLDGFLSKEQAQGICWTLLHSLWIGLVVAALAGAVMAVTMRSPALLRYRLFCGLLVVFILSVSVAGIYELGGNVGASLAGSPEAELKQGNIDGLQLKAMTAPSFLIKVGSFFDRYAYWILLIWMLLFSFKSLKLLLGLAYVQRIRTYQTQSVGEEWLAKASGFAAELGIGRAVSVIQSALVKVPVTLGYFKPVIVLPVGLLFSIPIAQVETILWHELAHIARRDYVINIFQKLLEAVFFFNPAVLWLSALIREEREACCDDIVLSKTEQKSNYLEALVSFHANAAEAGSLALALSLRPNQLMNRLRRMVNQQNKRLSVVELVVMVLGFILLSAFISIPKVDKGIKKSMAYINTAITGTLMQKNIETLKPANANPTLGIAAIEPIKAHKDSVALDTLMHFKSIRFKNDNKDKDNREMIVMDGKDNRYHIVVSRGSIKSVEVNGSAVAETGFGNYKSIVSQVDKVIDSKLSKPSSTYNNTYDPQHNTLKFKLAALQVAAAKKGDSLGSKPIQAEVKSLAEKLALGTEVPPQKKIPIVEASADRARVLGVLEELVQAGIVSSSSAVDWFALTAEQLVVNGQKQDGVLHRKLKEKYLIREANGLFFGPAKVHGPGVYFDKKDLQ